MPAGRWWGTAHTSSGYDHAFLYSNGKMTDLGTLPGGSESYAYGINASGQVVGYADTKQRLRTRFPLQQWDDDGPEQQDCHVLGMDLTNAVAINDNGLIVGQGVNSSGQTHAFLLTPAATIALTNAVNATIITGGTGTLGTTVSNSAGSGANNLNYTLTAAVQSGNATLGSLRSGSVAPGFKSARHRLGYLHQSRRQHDIAYRQ